MKVLKINDVVEAIEKRPVDWWIAVGFKDIEEALRYFSHIIEIGEKERRKTGWKDIYFMQVNNIDSEIIFDWLVKHGDIDEDVAIKNILNGCYWIDAVKYLYQGLKNI